MLGSGERKLFVCFDESEHRVIVWCWIITSDVGVDASLSSRTALGKLLDELIVEQFVRRRRLYKLQQKLR